MTQTPDKLYEQNFNDFTEPNIIQNQNQSTSFKINFNEINEPYFNKISYLIFNHINNPELYQINQPNYEKFIEPNSCLFNE